MLGSRNPVPRTGPSKPREQNLTPWNPSNTETFETSGSQPSEPGTVSRNPVPSRNRARSPRTHRNLHCAKTPYHSAVGEKKTNARQSTPMAGVLTLSRPHFHRPVGPAWNKLCSTEKNNHLRKRKVQRFSFHHFKRVFPIFFLVSEPSNEGFFHFSVCQGPMSTPSGLFGSSKSKSLGSWHEVNWLANASKVNSRTAGILKPSFSYAGQQLLPCRWTTWKPPSRSKRCITDTYSACRSSESSPWNSMMNCRNFFKVSILVLASTGHSLASTSIFINKLRSGTFNILEFSIASSKVQVVLPGNMPLDFPEVKQAGKKWQSPQSCAGFDTVQSYWYTGMWKDSYISEDHLSCFSTPME